MSTATSNLQDLDAEVRRSVYDAFINHGAAISQAQVAEQLQRPLSDIRDSFVRLAGAHILVLQPGSAEVLMANPFSAVPTAFRVQAGSRSWWSNCIWDALGICAMTGLDASVFTSCPDCGEGMSLTIENSEIRPAQGIAHFAVPASRWWEDIVFTCRTMLLFRSEEPIQRWSLWHQPLGSA